MSTASGSFTNAVFGFTSMFILVMKEQRPDQVLVALRSAGADVPPRGRRDLQGQPRRRTRPAAPADGARARGAVGARRGQLRARGRLEADDLVRHGDRAGQWHVARRRRSCVTGDRDAYQLVEGPPEIRRSSTTSRGVSDYANYDEAAHRREDGRRRRRRYPEYAALRGDAERQPPRRPRRRRDGGQARAAPTAGSTGSSPTSTNRPRSCAASLAEHEERIRQTPR